MAKKNKTFLFVCSGNTCRSVMAQYLMDHLLKQNKITGYTTDSAGVLCIAGDSCSVNARYILDNRGIKNVNHRTKPISPETVLRAAYILTMSRTHKEVIMINLPEASSRIFTLKEFTGLAVTEGDDISDPFGGSLKEYEACADEIEKNLQVIIEKIKNNNLPG